MYVHSWIFLRSMKKCDNPLWNSHASYPTTDFIANPRSSARPPRPPAAKAPGQGLEGWDILQWWCTWQLNEIEWGVSNRFVDLNIEINRANRVEACGSLNFIDSTNVNTLKHFVGMVLSPLIAEVVRRVISVRSLLQHLPHLAPQAREFRIWQSDEFRMLIFQSL